jgi:hypothetical protein
MSFHSIPSLTLADYYSSTLLILTPFQPNLLLIYHISENLNTPFHTDENKNCPNVATPSVKRML